MTEQSTNKYKIPTKKLIGLILGIVLGVTVSILPPFPGLEAIAMQTLGIFVGAVIFLIFEVLPDWVVVLIMATSFALIKAVSFDKAYAAFSASTVWLMIAAMGLGAAAAKTGLLERAALSIMRYFPKTYKGQIASFLISGTVISPFIPSQAARMAIVSPFGRAVSDQLGYPAKSKGAAGIFSALLLGFWNVGSSFLSASWLCYLVLGLYPDPYKGTINWISWFAGTWPFLVILLLGCYLMLPRMFKPDVQEKRDSNYIQEKLQELGPMKKNEKIAMAVLVICLAMWITESVHGIDATTVAILGFLVLGMANVLNRDDITSKRIPWDSVIFMGGVLSITYVFPAVNINNWIGDVFGPVLQPLMSNSYLFVVVSMVFFFLIRIVFVSMTAHISVFAVVLMPLMINAGWHPWAIGFMLVVSANTWIVKYQSAPFLMALYGSGEMVDHPQVIKSSLLFCVLTIIGMLASVPLWQILGMCP